MSRRGFSLAEALIAMAIGSLLLMGACRFLPALQRHILRQGEQLALENELWQRVHAVGKHLQRGVLPGIVRRSRAGASRWRRVSDCALGCEQQREMGNLLRGSGGEHRAFACATARWRPCAGPATAAAADGRKSPTRPPSW
ncbi:prepilin peptidase dependent protein B [Klebsiella pneumoniae]|uniref:Prepilin peptidase dependent protein B n=1 Tax=Klebsiella pneumoniae TaxID=573 RepID=A0A2X3IW06_KLEPN|nr:prepilin peptidase dependent protein B [Klebsiella pneumoniae]